MPRISIRVDHELHDRLRIRSRAAGLALSELLRPTLEDVAWPGGRYVYTGQDEILTIAIPTYALLAQDLVARAPAEYTRGVEAARDLLRSRGLLAPEDDPLQQASLPPSRDGRGA